MNELHTTINGVKEEGGIRDYREWKGDPVAKPHEWQWNGYPLPDGLRITDKRVSELPPGPSVRTEKQKAQRREQNKRRRARCAQLPLL